MAASWQDRFALGRHRTGRRNRELKLFLTGVCVARSNWKSFRSSFRERLFSPKVAVYTAITGNYDTLPPLELKVPTWSYLCFTDKPPLASAGWEIRPLPRDDLDQIRRSRLPKILAHDFLAEYDISIWIDASVGITGNLEDFYKIALARADIAFFRHGDLRPSVAAEIQVCAQLAKAPFDVMTRQYEAYRTRGFS